MHVHTAERAEPLAARLAEVYAEPPTDPFTPEWVAVPSEGMRRWLYLQLARHLGASGPDATDGVTANVRSAFPGSLRLQVLQAEVGEDDPWRVETLAWAVLAVADTHPSDPLLDAVNAVPAGGSRYARARRVADLFDRYHVHRPDMVRLWAMGKDADGSAKLTRLVEHHRWQPHLWRLVREHLATPSPPERMPDLLERLRAGDLPLDLPERLSFFGLSVLPGGSTFTELATAVAAHREVHLFLAEPSSSAASAVGAKAVGGDGPRGRAEDRSADLVANPLLRSWGRLHRETATLLAEVRQSGLFSTQWAAPPAPEDAAPVTVLQHVQADLRADRAPAGTVVPGPDDRSVQIHACYGPTRQVEVLRDAILHLLADPELDLTEDDIVVACPDLRTFAPIIEAVFGPSAERAWTAGGNADEHAPALRYRIADRAITTSNPVLAATASLLELVSGRFDAPSVLDFIALEPVRRRQHLSEDDLALIDEWVEDTNVRWGLDPAHREAHGLTPTLTANTWQAGLDRLLLGVAVSDDDLALSVGDVVPLGAEAGAADVVGRLAEILWRLTELARAVATPRTIEHWAALVGEHADALFATDRDDAWQLDALHRLLTGVVESSRVAGRDSATLLEFTDLRRLLAQQLGRTSGRPDFFRGGITISSLTPLRWIPSRAVLLLGMDQPALSAGTADGDDLAAANPRIGDRDPRGESRQTLLESLLAARERLVIVRDGHDVRTNQTVPPAVAVAELRDVVRATVHPDHRAAYGRVLEVGHPRQPFDERCFTPDQLGTSGPWSFDPGALAGALARQGRSDDDRPLLATPLAPDAAEVVELDDLRRFLKDPVAAFFARRLQVRVPERDDPISAHLPVELAMLRQWKVGDRLLALLLDGGSVDSWLRIEHRLGTLPPGVLGDAKAAELATSVEGLVEAAAERGLRRGRSTALPVDLQLDDGTRIVGAVEGRLDDPTPGPAFVTFSKQKPVHQLRAWLELMALIATDPTVGWHSLVVSRPRSGKAPYVADLGPLPGTDPLASARDALGLVVDWYRRATAEPLPYFPALSPQVHQGKPSADSWRDTFNGWGDGDDATTALAFPYELGPLLDLPALPHDPPGPAPTRVKRYADHLWTAVARTCCDLTDEAVGAGDAEPSRDGSAA